MLAALGAAVPAVTEVPGAQRAGCMKQLASRLSWAEQAEAFPAALPRNTIGWGGGGVSAPEAEAPELRIKGVSAWGILLLVLLG